ncbi:MAG: class I SAM-dependent methyltransferase, partial [Pseudomonadota bacterium]
MTAHIDTAQSSARTIDDILAWPTDMLPRVSALLAQKRYWVTDLFRALRLEYEAAIEGPGEPADPAAVEALMQELPSAHYVQWLHRYNQDQTWRLCEGMVADRLQEIEAALEPRDGDLGTLKTAPDIRYPPYYLFDYHRQRGGIWRDAAGAAIYLLGARIVHIGRNSDFQLHDQFVDSLDVNDPKNILDIGCGFGKTTFSLKRRWPEAKVEGIDLSAPCLALGRRMATERGLAIDWRQGDMELLPQDDASVDLAAITMVLHEMPAEAIATSFAEAARVLKPGGTLVTLENRWLGDPFRDTLLRWYSQIIDEPYSVPYRDLDIPAMASKAGFDTAET